MKVHIGGAPAEVAEFLEPFMKGVAKGSPGYAFQKNLVAGESVFEQQDDGAIEITSTGLSSGGTSLSLVYRVELSAARPGTNLNFELTDAGGIPPSVVKLALWSMRPIGELKQSKRAWEKEFTRYVQERTGPSLRMTMTADLAGM